MSAYPGNRFPGNYIIRQLRNAGVKKFFVSPGARSAPLVAALSAEETVTHFDERGMSFAALGHARATGKPTACITTSGSAVANLHPAAVEAFYSEIPLIFVTADRPARLLNRGANQTIDQQNIFGPSQLAFLNLPITELQTSGETTEQQLLDTLGKPISKLVQTACGTPSGPVHLNCPFDEPLLPDDETCDLPDEAQVADFTALKTKSHIRMFFDVLLSSDSKTLFLIGQLTAKEQKYIPKILELAVSQNWLLVPDVLSGLRQISHPNIFSYAHLWSKYASEESLEELRPRRVLHLGESLVSKSLGKWLSKLGEQDYIHISASPRCRNPYQKKIGKLQIPLKKFFSKFKNAWLPPSNDKKNTDWLQAFRRETMRIEAVLKSNLSGSEAGNIRKLSEYLTGDINLFLGNSMPIRDFDMFATRGKKKSSLCFGNRGASGIDGNIATACGVSAASGKTTLALLGDLTALHDLNSLALTTRPDVRGIFVVFNNRGGGIFRFLPLKIEEEKREALLETPHPFEFSKAAEMFSLRYALVENSEDFLKAFGTALGEKKLSAASWLIEIRSDRKENHSAHLKIAEMLRQVLT
ncbi:MAG: 2-succinyl-5-enolpyruvyl-6-hydroxy-3-cyclohexene-1-carboxylic-acid synthase [Chthoniobacterales bacterium]